MKQVDEKKYAGVAPRQEAGWGGMTSCHRREVRLHVVRRRRGRLPRPRRQAEVDDPGEPGRSKEGTISHGYHVSPILTDSEFVVSDQTTAFDKRDGQGPLEDPDEDVGLAAGRPGRAEDGRGASTTSTTSTSASTSRAWGSSRGPLHPRRKARVRHGLLQDGSFSEFTIPEAITADTKLDP